MLSTSGENGPHMQSLFWTDRHSRKARYITPFTSPLFSLVPTSLEQFAVRFFENFAAFTRSKEKHITQKTLWFNPTAKKIMSPTKQLRFQTPPERKEKRFKTSLTENKLRFKTFPLKDPYKNNFDLRHPRKKTSTLDPLKINNLWSLKTNNLRPLPGK